MNFSTLSSKVVDLSKKFKTQSLSTPEVTAARDTWDGHLQHAWGGAAKPVYDVADKLQKLAGLVMVGSLPSLGIPLVGQVLEGSEAVVYAAAGIVKGLARTSAENHAIEQSGGKPEDKGRFGTVALNALKSSIPVLTHS